MTAPKYGQQINVHNFPDKPKIGERHRECHREIMMLNDEVTDEKVLAIMAKHFPEDDSNKPNNIMKTGSELIAEERQRQIEKENWTAEHDISHHRGQLAGAAACYALSAIGVNDPRQIVIELYGESYNLWPWEPEWWKPTTPVRDLVKAGALIAAEIDRRHRQGEQ